MVNIKQIFNEKDLEMFDMEEKKALSGVIIENIIISRKQKKVDIYLMSKKNEIVIIH